MKLHIKIIIGIAVCSLLTMIGGAIWFFSEMKSAIKNQDPQGVMSSMVSLELPPGHKAEMGMAIFGFKTAAISREGKKQMLILMEMPAAQGMNIEDFNRSFRQPESGGKSEAKSFFERLNMGTDKKFEARVTGTLRLRDGTEMPYAIGDYERRGKEDGYGFMGVANFSGGRSLLVMDMADNKEYDFAATKLIVERMGPPVR